MPEVSATPGDLVRAFNVGGTPNNGQVVAVAAPKDFAATTVRSGITDIDIPVSGTLDPRAVGTLALKDATYLWIGGNCSIATGGIAVQVVHYDDTGKLMSVSAPYNLSATPKLAADGRFLCTPGVAVDVLGATSASVVVTAISGNWTLFYKPSY